MVHIPVLQKEVLEYLDPKPNENFIDCTIGEAGHSLAILEKNSPKGKVLGIDQDPEIIQCLNLKFQHLKRLVLVGDNFANLEDIVKKERFRQVSGILFDLGMSSWHLEESGRGFSFQKNEPLDMRYNPQNSLTAEKILNYWSKPEIEKILKDYGEEQFAPRIAETILTFRKFKPIQTTSQLKEIIKKATPNWYHRKRIHPATKVFQALRIAVNDELKNLEKVLPQALEILKQDGRLVIISFHSLEDRIVKNFFKNCIGDTYAKLRVLTKKPIIATEEEIKINPRSRSAKLRAGQKL